MSPAPSAAPFARGSPSRPPIHISIGMALDDALGGGSGGGGSLSPLASAGVAGVGGAGAVGVGGRSGGAAAVAGVGNRYTYHSSLHMLCHEGPRRRGNWDRVLHYLERHSSHTSVFSTAVAPKTHPAVLEMSPLDKTLVPSEDLREMGCRLEGPDGDDTPLRIAVMRGAPAPVVAALCQLFPPAAAMRDGGGRTPLHHAARRPTGGAVAGGKRGDHEGPGQDAHNVLKVLAAAHPNAVVARDARGMTPLHVLFSVHAESRSVATVELLCGEAESAYFAEEMRRQREDNARLAELEELDGMAGVAGAASAGLVMPSLGEGVWEGDGRRRKLGGIHECSEVADDADGDEENEEQGIEIEQKSPFSSGGKHRTFTFQSPSARQQPPPPKIRPLPRLPPLPRTPLPTKMSTPSRASSSSSSSSTSTAARTGDDFPARNVPPSPTVVPDSVHGCLPLHYAVMNGATIPALCFLLGKYPASIRTGDRYGRTALGWYLGGSEWEAEEKELDAEREYAAVTAARDAGRASSSGGVGGGGGDDSSVAASYTSGGGATCKDDQDDEGTVVADVAGGNSRSPHSHGAGRGGALLFRSSDPAEVRRKIGMERARAMRSVVGSVAGDVADDFLVGSSLQSSPIRGKRGGADAFSTLLHRHRRSTAVVSLLLNQSVAGVADAKKRLPLHFAVRLFVLSLLDPSEEAVAEMESRQAAAFVGGGGEGKGSIGTPNGRASHGPTNPPSCVALKTIELIIETNRLALVHPDTYGRTPLHVLFATAHTWNKREYHSLVRNEKLHGRYVDGIWRKGAIGARPFRPPGALVRMLLQRAVAGKKSVSWDDSQVKGRNSPQGRMGVVGVGAGVGKFLSSRASGTSSAGLSAEVLQPVFSEEEDCYDDEYDSDSDEESDGYGSVHEGAVTAPGGASTTSLSSRGKGESGPKQVDDCTTQATHAEDRWGLLPLHYAVVTVCPNKVLRAMVQSHPASLLHTSYGPEEKERLDSAADKDDKEDSVLKSSSSSSSSSSAAGGGSKPASVSSRRALGGLSRTPLHLAFSSPYTARLHTAKTLSALLEPPPLPAARGDGGGTLSPRTGRGRRGRDYARERAEAEAEAAAAAVDGRLALKMEDGTGRYPLHLAAEHGASPEVLSILLDAYEAAARMPNRQGDLPVHLILDSHLLMNVEVLALGEDGGDEDCAVQLDGARLGGGAGSLDEFHKVRQRRAKVRTLSAQSARLARTGVGGAVFGQLHGWTSDEDEARFARARLEIMKRADLLLRPVLGHCPSLGAADSRHGMTPLHIAVAFHAATYEGLHRMLRTMPSAARIRTATGGSGGGGGDASGGKGFTALDLHVLRRRFPGEVPPEEMTSWHAVRELLFSYELYPLTLAADSSFQISKAAGDLGVVVRRANLAMYRRDRDLLMRCAATIRAEAIGIGKSPHKGVDAHPIDPLHIEIGVATGKIGRSNSKNSVGFDGPEEKKDDGDDSKGSGPEESAEDKVGRSSSGVAGGEPFELSDVGSRLWTFIATFNDRSNPDDHYAPYVELVLSDMDFRVVHELVMMRLPDFCASEKTGTVRNLTGLTIRDCANVHSKAVMHSTFYFAGLYDFTPPPPPSLGLTTTGDDDIGDTNGDRRGESILLRRGPGERTLLLRAIEHRFTTEGVQDGSACNAGASSGADTEGGVEMSATDSDAADLLADPSAHNRLLSSFRVTARPVCVKFIMDRESFKREKQMRVHVLGDAGVGLGLIAPILADYDSTGNSRPSDIRFRNDVKDPRFQTLRLYHSPESAGDNTSAPSTPSKSVDIVDISKYPYAIVLPLSIELDLGTQFRCGAIDSLDDIKRAGFQVGRSLRFMHSKGVIHGNVCLDNVIGFQGRNERHKSVLTDFSFASIMDIPNLSEWNVSSFLGEISCEGNPRFALGALPPEMFTKLSPMELDMYEAYWEQVGKIEGVTIRRDIIAPLIDPKSGVAVVVKCYCKIEEKITEGKNSVPKLPYDLLRPSPAIDLWSFGVMLFTLCTGGHSLFPTNFRTGAMSSLDGIVNWSKETAEHIICERVHDPVAQDILLHLLSSHEQRSSLTMDTILNHPFFSKPESLSDEVKQMLRKLSEQRVEEMNKRQEQMKKDAVKQAEIEWVESRTTTVNSPTLDFRMKMIHSASEMMKLLLGATEAAPVMPYSFIILPYKLVRSKSGKLTPSHKKDVEMAEKVGRLVLGISRASVFVSTLEAGLKKDPVKAKEAMQRWASACAAYGEETDESPEAAGVLDAVKRGILAFIGLDVASFMDVASVFLSLIRAGKESFLSNPLFEARKIIQKMFKELLDAYAGTKNSYLYLVDEYKGVPIIPPANDDGSEPRYPHVISENVTAVVLKAFPFMQMSVLNARASAGGISGLVRLIFEGAYPHIPPTWSSAANGLMHHTNQESMVGEVKIIRRAMEEMPDHLIRTGMILNGDEELRSFRDFFNSFDKDQSYAGLQRVTDGKASLWTERGNIKEIEDQTGNLNAIKIFRDWESKEKEIKEKDKRIAELEKALQELSRKS